MVLENLDHAVRRQAKILAEVVGFGCTADAGHLVQPEPTGSAASTAIQIALADANYSRHKWTILMLMEHRLH
ncbi:MAG: hypothetical protein CM1200mP15_16550 [Dehalococcoidia bacterium]|nr:MAG: hypothetical protein CM1200mP15_16550 [Dehalococcoidia bacterium]